MRFRWKLITLVGTLASAGMSTQASAAVSVAGFNFENNAFADVLLSSSGTFLTNQAASVTVADVLTDVDVSSLAFSLDPGAFIELGFTDNVAVNGAGDDLVVFELGSPNSFAVTINGNTRTFLPTDTGFRAGAFINAAPIDLSVFGVAPNGSISSLRIDLVRGADGSGPALSLIGALNVTLGGGKPGAVPEPATWGMMILGFGMVGGVIRSARRKQKVFVVYS